MEMEKQIQILNIDDILPNRFQPRIKFNEQAINELAESIKLHGVIQPIVVRKISDKYEIIAGERRYKASILAGKTTIPAIITSLDDKNSAEVALIENVQRQDLTPIEEAISYKKILDMGYISQEALGEKLGKKQSTIANKLRLLNLNDEVQEALMENKISERHARSLLKLNNEQQIIMLNRIISERMTVRKTDEEIEKLLNNNSSTDNGEQKIKEIKGENEMNNNDVLKEFNIPTEPIVDNDTTPILFEDEEAVNEINNQINPQQSVENSQMNINPGFMDIDKIEKEAVDIVSEPEPTANMDDLLKAEQPSVSVMEQVTQPLPSEESPVPVSGGKFFNMFNFNNQEKDENFVSDVEEKQVNMDFGETTLVTPNIFENTTQTSEIDQTMNEHNILDDEINPQQPVENSNIDSFKSIPNDDYIFPTPKPINSESNESINNQENNDSIMNFTSPVQPFNLNDDEEFTNSTIGSPISNNYVVGNNVTFDENGEIEVSIPSSNEKFVTADMKTVINTIRDCAATIEKYGFKIDTEEIDLENIYQVTFKIDKNV